jgi:hypothetical protein
MTLNELKKEIRLKLELGLTPNQVLDDLRSETNYSDESIAKIIRVTPSLENRRKNRQAHSTFVCILILTVLGGILLGINMVMDKGVNYSPMIVLIPLVSIIVTVQVVRHRIGIYIPFVLLLGLGMIKPLLTLTSGITTELLIDLILRIVLITLSLYLYRRLQNNYEIQKLPYENKEGKPRLKLEVKFEDC